MSAFHDNALMGASGSQGYQISRSVRLRSSASAYFTRTPASAGNRKTWTWSGWVKRGTLGTASQWIFTSDAGGTDQNEFNLNFLSTDKLYVSGAITSWRISTPVYRDPSGWYHIVLVVDTTQVTANNRIRIYVNGVEVTAFDTLNNPTLNDDLAINQASQHNIGIRVGNTSPFDGYLTEINFIDGQALTPSSFGENDTVTGVWKPKKYAGTYGANGFYLNFSDNSNNTAATIGKDYSGNGNNWTPNNISVTSGVTYDSMLDVPTPYADGGNGRGNYAVLNPLAKSSVGTLDNANMRWTCANSGGGTAGNGTRVSIGINSGKWYAECTVLDTVFWSYPGISNESHSTSTYNGGDANSWSVSSSGQKVTNNSASAYGSATWAANDIVNIAYDADNGELYFGKNGTWLNSGNPATRTNPAFTGLSGTQFFTIGFSSNTASTSQVAFNCGQQPFTYTPPSGFKALNTQNLPDSTIKKGNQYFDVSTWTGDQTSRTITNSGAFQPDFVWTKSRSDAESHRLHDAVRGGNGSVLYELNSNETSAEGTDTLVSGFASNGFTIASGANSPNVTGRTYVGWQWKEGATQGFDIVTYTGTGANTTVAHSLGVAPKMMIVKNRTFGGGWVVYHASLSSSAYYLILNSTAAQANTSAMFNGAPTSSVINLGNDAFTNRSGDGHVSYLFSEVAGFSRMGSYQGNGSSDGSFVYCGFRPRWVMTKRTDSVGSWLVVDSARNSYNVVNGYLVPNTSDAEGSATWGDFTANGFKLRGTTHNGSGESYIFAAFAENPFKNALAR